MDYKDISNLKILVVDDEPEFLQIMELILKKQNYSVSTVCNGEECFKSIRADKPDLLLLDVMLPDILGFEICRTIKNDPDLSSIFVVLLSATQVISENISKGLEIGADDYLVKPIKNRELLARVGAAARIIFTEKKLKHSQEQLKKFTSQLLALHEEEKSLLATQLDNELNQSLVALKMNIGFLNNKILNLCKQSDSDELKSSFENLNLLAENAINASMRLMNNLRNEVLYLVGIEDAIRFYIAEIESKFAIKCSLNSNIPSLAIDKNTETSLFRIFQSAMVLTVRNTKSTLLEIKLTIENEKIVLQLNSNSFASDESVHSNAEDIEINNLKERVKLLNGTLEFDNKVNFGFNILVEIPYSV